MVSKVVKKLTQKQESEVCLSCGECCRIYWITVLPMEAKEISAQIKVPLKRFLWEDCLLNVKLYPKSVKGKLTFSSEYFPKRLKDLLVKSSGTLAPSYFVLPQVVLKRGDQKFGVMQHGDKLLEGKNACIFLDEENKCFIYSKRPTPCKLFPFIAMPNFREQYPFCELFKKTFKDYSKESKKYYSEIQDYFDSVDKNGIEKIFPALPKKGFVFLQDSLLGEISIEELEQMTQNK